jgi:hypothetical protein
MYSCGDGTTHLNRHTDKCFKPPTHDVGMLLDNNATFLKRWKFDSIAYRDSLSRSIIRHDLPFSFAEYDGINATNKILNPDLIVVLCGNYFVSCVIDPFWRALKKLYGPG